MYLLFLSSLLLTSTPLPSLYASLDPQSVAQHFAFYELYPHSKEGREALQHAWELLGGNGDPEMILPTLDLQPLISYVNRSGSVPTLPLEQLDLIDRLSRPLANRKLKGHSVWSLEEMIALPSEEVDLARAFFLAEDGQDRQAKARQYEAMIDLMALQILARLPPNATDLQKVRAINDFVFDEMQFRYPPRSLDTTHIDQYTFLASVIDAKRGVCLGVSTLYLCLAQRLDLAIEAITPPGHIYVRYVSKEGEITNIETTARGIDIPSERYLSLQNKELERRETKEVVGLTFMNQASAIWHGKNYNEAIRLYEKARPFVQNDYLLDLFEGLNLVLAGREAEGRAMLEKIRGVVPSHMITADTLSEDYLSGRCDAAALEAIFSEVDGSRASVLKKQAELKEVVAKWPLFRQGHFHLAISYIQLGRQKEALPILTNLAKLDPDDPTLFYYLAALHAERTSYHEAWKYLHRAEMLTASKQHYPRALQELRAYLQHTSPEF
jgi:tetratricopeptide (TPR) repeat protein